MKTKLLITSQFIGALFITSIVFILLVTSFKVSPLFATANNKNFSNIIVTSTASNFRLLVSANFAKPLKTLSSINCTLLVAFNNNIHSTYNITKVNFTSVLGKNTSNTFTI